MTKVNSDFENERNICTFNNSGYCKFQKKCKKEHFENECEIKNCDEKCLNRHPIHCKYENRCKFLKKKICAFKHSKVYNEAANVENKDLKKEIKELKDLVRKQQKEFDDKTNNLKKELDVQKENNEKLVYENIELKVKLNQMNLKIETTKNLYENLEERVTSKLMKDNEKVIKSLIENNKVVIDKAIKDAFELNENIKSVQEKNKDSKNGAKVDEAVKTKPKHRKLTKEEKEKMVIGEFEKDGKEIFETRTNCGLKLDEIKCKKCEFETFSDGLIRLHKRNYHQLKESNQNIILGFKNDIIHHRVVLEAMDELNKKVCTMCEFKTNSKGELKIHEQEQHCNE